MTSAWKSPHLFPVEWKGPVGGGGKALIIFGEWGAGAVRGGLGAPRVSAARPPCPRVPFPRAAATTAAQPALPSCSMTRPAPPGASSSPLPLRWAGPLAPLHPARAIDEPRDLSPGSRGERPGPALARPQPRMNNNSLTARPLKGSSSRTHFWKGWGFLFPR